MTSQPLPKGWNHPGCCWGMNDCNDHPKHNYQHAGASCASEKKRQKVKIVHLLMTFTWCHLPHQWVYCVGPNNVCLTAWNLVETWPYCWPDRARCWMSLDNIFPVEGRGMTETGQIIMMGSQALCLWKHWSDWWLRTEWHKTQQWMNTNEAPCTAANSEELSVTGFIRAKLSGMLSLELCASAAPLTRGLTVPPSAQSGKWALQKEFTIIRTSEWT